MGKLQDLIAKISDLRSTIQSYAGQKSTAANLRKRLDAETLYKRNLTTLNDYGCRFHGLWKFSFMEKAQLKVMYISGDLTEQDAMDVFKFRLETMFKKNLSSLIYMPPEYIKFGHII